MSTFARGRPLPLVRDLPSDTVGDPLARVNLRLLGRQAASPDSAA